MVSSGAEIQPDKNWAKVHNGILEVLASTNFTAREMRCLLYLLRMTYGERCKEQAISLNDWTAGTKLKRPHVVATLQELVSRNVITKTETGKRTAPIWSFNKYFEQWQGSTPVGTFSGTPMGTKGSTPMGTKGSTPMGTKGSTPSQSTSTVHIEEEEEEEKKKDASSGDVFRLWEDNVRGTLTSIVADDLNDLIDTYGANSVIDAITEAVRSNVRSVRYVARILESWAAGKTRPPEKKLSTAPPPAGPVASGKVTGFDYAALIGG